MSIPISIIEDQVRPIDAIVSLDIHFSVPERLNKFAQLKAKNNLKTSVYEFVFRTLLEESIEEDFNRQLEKLAYDFIHSLPETKREAIIDRLDCSLENVIETVTSVGTFSITSKHLAAEVDAMMKFEMIVTPYGVYSGYIREGKPCDISGRLTMLDGTIITGQFIDGKAVSGEIIWKTGDRYLGNIEDNDMKGLGTYICKNYKIEATWKDHLIIDVGKSLEYLGNNIGDRWFGQIEPKAPFLRLGEAPRPYVYADGSTLEGKWYKGNIIYGEYKRPDGTYYVGDFGYNSPTFSYCRAGWPDKRMIVVSGDNNGIFLLSSDSDPDRWINIAEAIALLGYKLPA